MIKKIENIQELIGFKNTVFSCRICASAQAYGIDTPFVQLWRQDDRALLCKLDDVMLLDAEPDADFAELREFLQMIGARTLLCDASFEAEIRYPSLMRGCVMRYSKENRILPRTGYELNPSLRDVHALLCDCKTDSFLPPEFEPFYLDMSHRIRHGAALSVGIRESGTLTACALCTAMTEDTAVISSVAVRPAFRRQGLGRIAVQALLAELKRDMVYLFRSEHENQLFYQSLGFENCGSFAEFMLNGDCYYERQTV